MLALLAQAAESQASSDNPAAGASTLENLFETTIAVFSRGDALARPEELINNLQALSVVWALVFMVLGVTCLLNGFKFYKVMTIGIALLLGMFFGYWVGAFVKAPYAVAGCLGLIAAVTAAPLMKYAVALFGGLCGAFLGANIWSGLTLAINDANGMQLPEAHWVGALMGLIICGMLAFIVFDTSIMMFTAVAGATLAVIGGLALVMSFEPWRETIANSLVESNITIPLLVTVPAVIGIISQINTPPAPAAKG
ncbi:NAD(P)(+) transhydrogenase (Re/Si-specific) subunit beta [Mucisphaera calidilacus]|uniref:DUF4203 domain-containing protein n=1 Tax=Mucisphaera calidilacus TaxID=2527982 RepID=A0A518BWD9_9BACT|nr:NAD(P)(+) transhydrogenase (Re/Si-specific) subunit beta [Mucisphaera calidilacus]QDU71290.1 hypothetical protein Pan265_11390 [Mucisphaera calidilacus]